MTERGDNGKFRRRPASALGDGVVPPPPPGPPAKPAAPAPIMSLPMAWGSSSPRPPRPIGAPRELPPIAAPEPPAPPPSPAPASAVEPPAQHPPSPAPTASTEGQNNASHAANNYADARRTRDAAKWRTAQHVPQGEIGLLGAWTHAVTTVPAYAMTIWLRRVDPQAGAYEILIYGDAVASSDFPERALYDEVRKQRRQPTVAERFIGRIRALTADGQTVDVGSGEIALPPEPTGPTATPWSNPGSPWGPSPWPMMPGAPPSSSSSPWGPPPSPWGSPWGWGGGAGGYGFGYGGPMMAMQHELAELRAKLAAQPPAALQGHPELVELWRVMNETLASSQRHNQPASMDPTTSKVLELAFSRLAKDNVPAAQVDPFSMLERVLTIADKLGGGGKGGGLTIHQVGDGMLVENKDGDLDVGASAVLSVLKEGKATLGGIASALKAKGAQIAANGSGAVRPQGPRPAAASPTANGSAPKALDK